MNDPARTQPVRATLRALATASPTGRRDNDWFRAHYGAIVRSAEERALNKVWAVRDRSALTDFEHAMLPYLDDPFRGTVDRRVLAADESSEELMVTASHRALDAAGLRPSDIDLLLSCSFPSGQNGIGEAAFVSRALGLEGSSLNVESACASALVALEVATAMIDAGRARRALIATACTYSRVCPPEDTLGWTVGDGGAAMIVEADGAGATRLGAHSVHTAETCDAIRYALDERGLRMETFASARDSLRDVSERTVAECCRRACEQAGVALSDIALFVPNTPTAWFAAFFARKLGVSPERVVDCYPRFANIGPALWPTSLHAASDRLRPGDLVLLYAVGSVASAGATVLRWGDVALGERP